MNKYVVLMSEYSKLKDQEKDIGTRLSDIREEIEKLLHEDVINEINIESQDGKIWNCKYQQTKRRSINYEVLNELVSSQDYNLIVQENVSESLTIREKKSSSKKPKRGAPNPISKENDLRPPQGTIGAGSIQLV